MKMNQDNATIFAYTNKVFDECLNENGKESEISIGWRNLSFEAKELFGEKKPILRSLNASFHYHSLNGLMGPSGAGKTTLLNCLSGNDRCGLTNESEIYLNSKEKSPVSYFITQHVHESIVGRMRVLDIFRYAYRFKNGSSAIGRMDEHIGTVMAELMLPVDILSRHFAQCSGGEQKRIAIGQELMTLNKPTFLFVDEPTTGLDSAAAFEVMKCLKQLTTKYRMTVIASIHVPSDEILQLFDRLYVLAKGGVCIYSDLPSKIKPYLKNQIQMSIHEEQPPVEALIRIACNGMQDLNVHKLANHTSSHEYQSITTHLPKLSLKKNGLPNPRKHFSIRDFVLQFTRLFHITFIAKYQSLLLSILLFVIYFTLLATLFDPSMTSAKHCIPLDQDEQITCKDKLQSENMIKENGNFLANVLIYTGVVTICTSTVLFSSIVKVFRNEHRNHWYSLGVFYWSSIIVSFIELAIYALLNASLGYFLPSQHSVDNYSINWNRFGHYIFFMWLLCFYMQSIGQLVGALFVDHVELAIVISLIYHTSACMINGFFVDTERAGNPLVTGASSLIAFKYISWGIVYTFYGIDRCDWTSEYSLTLKFFHIELGHIQEYVLRVLANVLVVRCMTLVIMYFKFNTFDFIKHKQIVLNQMKSIDFTLASVIELTKKSNINLTEMRKAKNEINFNEFSTNKIIIGWRNLSLYKSSSFYEIGSKSTTKPESILRNLNGQFRFGTLNALMGTSGAGKTSLLRVLNGQCKTRLSNETLFYLSRFTKIETCFITQEVSGHLMPGLTAKQSLVYASRLKNVNMSVDHEKIAMDLLDELDLIDTVDTKVDRCSGGERKRLALALELTSIRMPNLICIDEPTSGLDSNSAETVISCLHKLTRTHHLTILASIHQPNTSILSMFDQLYVLARGGVCIYSGSPNQIQCHLNRIPETKLTESKFAIETLTTHSCSDYLNPIAQKMVKLENTKSLNESAKLSEDTQPVLDGVQRNRQRLILQSIYILLLRNIFYFRGHLWKEWLFFSFNYLFYGFVIPLFYNRSMVHLSGCIDLQDDFNNTCTRTTQSEDDDIELVNNFKYNFFYTIFFMIFIMIQFSLSFLKELKFFENEHRNGWYSTGSFYLVKSLLEILPLVPIIFIYVHFVNWFEDIIPGIYWQLIYLFILGAIAHQGMAHMFALLSRANIGLLIILSITVFLFFVLLSNFLLLHSRLHYVYQFVSNIAISRFLFEAVMLLQFGFGRCAPNEIQAVLYSMGLKDADFYHCLLMLAFNIVLYRVIAIWLLIRKANPVENRRQRVRQMQQHRETLKPSKAIIPGLSMSQKLRIKLTHF